MPTLVGPLLNRDKVSVGRHDRDPFLTLLDLQPHGLPLLRNHCPCCVIGEVVDLMLTADGRTWAVATTDLAREACAGYVFSLGGRVVGEAPADAVTPRPVLLDEVSLVERSGSATGAVRWQPETLRPYDRGGYTAATTADERQVLEHAAGRIDFQRRAGVIEVDTLPERHPASVATMTRTRVGNVFEDEPMPTARGPEGEVWRTRFYSQGLRVR